MVDPIERAEPTHEHETGALRSIEKIEDIPKRILEAIFEGLAKEPSKWMIMAFGFYLGWKGIDVFKHFMNIINGLIDIGSDILKDLGDAVIKTSTLAVLPAFDAVSFLLSLFGSITGPSKAKAPDAEPDTSFRESETGVVHKGRGYSPSVAKTSAEVEADIADPEQTATDADGFAHDLDVRMIAGAMGAISAVMITQPGFFAGIGEIVKGIGEIVPL